MPDMSMVDYSKGLKMLGGNAGIYVRLLGKFRDSTTMAELESALSAGDIETAAGKAHALKGVVANLSLTPLYQCAMGIETTLKAGTAIPVDGEDYKELRRLYDETLETVKAIIADPSLIKN